MFSSELTRNAEQLLIHLRQKGLKITTAESCTGGLIVGLLTEIAGCSDVVDCGFITYSNDAKVALIDVPEDLLETYGVVSEEVARAMAEGALKASPCADISVSVTGIAGPTGGSPEKPVGLVYISSAKKGLTLVEKHEFGPLTRREIREKTVIAALRLADQVQEHL